MAPQMYLIHPRDRDAGEAREEIAGFIAQRGGFILMATSYGSLVAAFDEMHLDAVKRHALVDFAGGVSLDPSAPGAAALQQLFARNVAAQLVERGVSLDGPPQAPEAPIHSAFRPLRWPAAPPPAEPLLTTTEDEEEI